MLTVGWLYFYPAYKIMKEAVDPRSAEGRELQDLLQSQILQIVRTLRKTNLRRENRSNASTRGVARAVDSETGRARGA